MRIIDLSKEAAPDGEVLAIGHQDEIIVGYLTGHTKRGFECESDGQVLDEVTHVIKIEDVRAYFLNNGLKAI